MGGLGANRSTDTAGMTWWGFRLGADPRAAHHKSRGPSWPGEDPATQMDRPSTRRARLGPRVEPADDGAENIRGVAARTSQFGYSTFVTLRKLPRSSLAALIAASEPRTAT